MRFLGSKYAINAYAAGAPPRTPLGELTALPRPLAGFKGSTSVAFTAITVILTVILPVTVTVLPEVAVSR